MEWMWRNLRKVDAQRLLSICSVTSLVQKELIPTPAGDPDKLEKQNNANSEDHQAQEDDI